MFGKHGQNLNYLPGSTLLIFWDKSGGTRTKWISNMAANNFSISSLLSKFRDQYRYWLRNFEISKVLIEKFRDQYPTEWEISRSVPYWLRKISRSVFFVGSMTPRAVINICIPFERGVINILYHLRGVIICLCTLMFGIIVAPRLFISGVFFYENPMSDRRQNDGLTIQDTKLFIDVGPMSIRCRIFITTFMLSPRLYRTSGYMWRGCQIFSAMWNGGWKN